MLSALSKRQKKYTKTTLLKSDVPKGIYIKCPYCKKNIYRIELVTNMGVCTNCSGYLAISPSQRISKLVDSDSFREFDKEMKSKNPLEFEGYEEKIQSTMQAIQQNEAVVTGKGTIKGIETIIAVMDTRFIMGSMGSVVGEKIARAIEYATLYDLPVVIFSASGGARMQEGIFSLMQMAKTSAALARHDEKGLLYISVLTNPTTGGVTASFAMLGDIIIAEPKALVGFAGPRVIEQTIREKLAEGFQRSEFLLEHGMIDFIVERKNMREELYTLLKLHVREE